MTADFITALLVNAAVFSALLGILLIVRVLMGKRLSALLRYALWAVVIIKLLIPFGFESHISPIEWLPHTPIQTTADALIAPSSADYEAQPVAFDDAGKDEATKPSTALQTNIASPLPQSLPAASAAAPQTISAAPLSWTDWTFIAWSVGAAIACCWLLLCRYQIWRNTTRRSVQPNTHLLDMFEQCKQELGIRRNIRLRVQSAASVPAITGLTRPLLLIPCNLTNADNETLRHVFLHELTHYKRGDLAVLALLNLLSCVYWFNPLTWLAFKLVRRDMETVCDQRVLQRIAGASRSGYIQTVLHFAGASTNRRLSAALSLNDGRVHMEKRIRNMFRTRRTGIRAKIMAICVSLLLLAACVLTACQPEQGISFSQQSIFIESVAQSEYAADVSQEVKSRANVTVHIDADANVPDVSTLPVYTVAQGKLTQQYLDRLADYFLPENPSYYKLFNPSPYDYTKQEVQENLEQARAELEQVRTMSDAEFEVAFHLHPDKLFFMNDGTSIPAREVFLTNYETNITYIEEQLASAPDEITFEKQSGGLHLFYEANNVFTDMEDGRVASIGGTIDGIGYSSNALVYIHDCSSDAPQPNGISMTRQKAIDTATDLLSHLGITGMMLSDVGTGNVYERDYIGQMQSYAYDSEAKDTQCWEMVFSKSIHGIPAIFSPGNSFENVSGNTIDRKVFGLPEEIKIAVDDTGVLSFNWSYPFEITGTVTENTKLLPFDDILDAALDSMYYNIEPIEGFDTSIMIDTIQLRYVMVTDEYDNYQLIPVWDFIGDAVRSDGTTSYTLDDNRVFLTVDALDGSVINLTNE